MPASNGGTAAHGGGSGNGDGGTLGDGAAGALSDGGNDTASRGGSGTPLGDSGGTAGRAVSGGSSGSGGNLGTSGKVGSGVSDGKGGSSSSASSGGSAGSANKGGSAGSVGKGGSVSSGGSSGKGGSGGSATGGTAGTTDGPCLGRPQEFTKVEGRHYVNTGFGDGGDITPGPASGDEGLFTDGRCICVEGNRGEGGWAEVYVQFTPDGLPFTSLDLKLAIASGSAIPKLVVSNPHVTPDYCHVFTPTEEATLRRGESVRIANTALHESCDVENGASPAPGETMKSFNFSFDSGPSEFSFCISKLQINP
jgi:hypothetical protein